MLHKMSPYKPTEKVTFECSDSDSEIEIKIGPSDTKYELLVHTNGQPKSVVVNSKTIKQLANKKEYDKAEQGWYWGSGCFYGSPEIVTLNIKCGEQISGCYKVRIVK